LWLTQRQVAVPPPVETLVLPRLSSFTPPPPAAEADDDGPAGTEPGGPVFAGLREYAYGDDLRMVNWTASARSGTGALLVRQDVVARTAAYRLVLDPHGEAAGFETAVDIVYSVAYAIHRAAGHRLAVTTLLDGRIAAARDLATAERVLAMARPCGRHRAKTHTSCLATLMRSASSLRQVTIVVSAAGPASVPRAGRVIVFRVGTSGAPRRSPSMLTLPVSDADAAAEAWTRLVRT
jgi:uncharacterized protein (DUF58 family)